MLCILNIYIIIKYYKYIRIYILFFTCVNIQQNVAVVLLFLHRLVVKNPNPAVPIKPKHSSLCKEIYIYVYILLLCNCKE